MQEKPKLELTNTSETVPAFTCLVYVSQDSGQVSARVANLADIEAVGSSERDALGKVVPEFKRRIAELLAGGGEIPWIEPPLKMQAGEQKRIVPVHL